MASSSSLSATPSCDKASAVISVNASASLKTTTSSRFRPSLTPARLHVSNNDGGSLNSPIGGLFLQCPPAQSPHANAENNQGFNKPNKS